tara:strand:- start:255 stop:530 length:276 start_codon:yes stop_codon:yes gene_type:complete
MENQKPTPGKAPTGPTGPTVLTEVSPVFANLYILYYLKANAVHIKIFQMSRAVSNIQEAYTACKEYCNINSLRFCYVTQAVELLELPEKEN